MKTLGWAGWTRLLAWLSVGGVAGGTAAAVVLSDEKFGPAAVGLWLLVTAAVGGLLASRVHRNPIGWLLLGVALGNTVHALADEYARYVAPVVGPRWDVQAAGWIALWLSVPSFGLLGFVLLLFPDGHLPSRRWWPAAATAASCLCVATVAVALQPGNLPATGAPNPLGITTVPWLTAESSLLRRIVEVVGSATVLAVLLSLVVRYRRATGVQRQQLRWLRLGAVTLVAGLLFAAVSPALTNELSFVAAILGLLALPVSIGVAVLRYRLWDLDLVVNRALVSVAVTVGVAGIYVASVVSVGTVFDRALGVAASLAATAIVAVVFQPLRRRVQQLVDRLMYGEHRDPYSVVAGLNSRLHAALDPAAVPELVVATLTGPVGLDYAAVEFDHHGGAHLVAAAGTRHEPLAAVPLTYQGEDLGRIVYRAPARPARRLTERLLADVARQAAPALHALRLTSALQRSREHLVVAREEERRRLRADLHDQLGPQLAGLTLGLEAAGNILRHDPVEASDLLVTLQERTRDAVGTVRGVIEGLRPAALDQFGLVEAIRERADLLAVSGGLRLSVTAEPLPPLPAAVEVAAYHIALEALTNTVRHAGARTAVVTLQAQEAGLRLEVRDDGHGMPSTPSTAQGVGVVSMRERAAELGGQLLLTSSPRGTTVSAFLPFGVAP